MIRLQPHLFALLDKPDPGKVVAALQAALRLEQATMPPYLYALYSLRTENRDVRKVLGEVVREEMLHMVLVGNMIKAVGGRPCIDSAAFPMTYPGPLPGSVASELSVRLRPYSREHVSSVFMEIEEPLTPLDFPVRDVTPEPARTIGEFYGRLRELFESSGDVLIPDPSGAGQLEAIEFDVEQKIVSAAGAMAAIDLIVQQGEGTDTEPVSPHVGGFAANESFAHYYRFAELVNGRLKPQPDATPETPPADRYFYDSADPVTFDPTKVIALVDDPVAATYAAGSDAAVANAAFNVAYTQILRLLQQAYDGDPARLEDAISRMPDLSGLGRAVAAIALDDGRFAGPTFEYVA